MANATQLFKDDEEEKLGKGYVADDDQLRHITGIGKDEEAQMDRDGAAGAADDLAGQEATAGTSPAASTKSNDDAGKSAASTGTLAAAEGIAAGGLYNAAALGGVQKLGAFFWGSKRRKQATIGGGIGGLVLGFAFFGLSVTSGPLQFVHMAQLLQQFHLQEQSDETDERASKLTRFYRYARTGKVEQTRLGVFANSYANRIEKQLNSTGIESGYDKYGRFTGYVIDTQNDNFKGKSNEGIKQYFKDAYGIDVSTNEIKGKLTINMEKQGYFAQRKLIGGMLQEAGYKGVSGAIRARIMGERAGITWHPIKKLDNKAKSKLADIWESVKANRDSNMRQGAPDPVSTADKAQNDPNKTAAENQGTQANASDTQAAAQDGIEAAKAAADGKPAALKGILGGVGIGVSVIGIACVVKGIADNVNQIKYAQVALPLMRMGMEAVSLGNQVMFGGQDNPDFMQELSYYQQFMTSTEKGNTGSWTDARSIQAELGQKEDGIDADSTAKSVASGNPLSFMTTGVLGSGLSAACNSTVQTGLTVVSFFGGPVSAAVGLAVSQALSTSGILETIAGWVAGKAINYDTASGPQYGNYVNYGVRLAANEEAISAGGRQLSSQEVAQLDGMQKSEATIAFQQHSIWYRMLNPDDSRTLVGALIDAQNPKLPANVSQTASGILRLTGSIFSVPAKLFASAGALSDTSYDYGFPKFGFSAAELNNSVLDNPYSNANYVLNNDLLTKYADRVQTCFNITVDASGNVQSTATEQGTAYNPYAPSYSGDCADTSQDWLRVRMYIFDTETADSLSCYQGDATACSNVGFGTSTTVSAARSGQAGVVPNG